VILSDRDRSLSFRLTSLQPKEEPQQEKPHKKPPTKKPREHDSGKELHLGDDILPPKL
jgi:hypothetical protein